MKLRRRQLWYGLATAFSLFCLAECCVPLLSMYREHRAIVALKQLRGTVETAPGGPAWLRRIVGDEWMRPLDHTRTIRVLLPDEWFLGEFQSLSHLEELSVRGDVTDAGVADVITGMHNLRMLDLGRTKITDAGLAQLRSLHGLEGLGLRETKITDAGLASIGELKQLRRLDLSYTQISDAGLVHLRALTHLEHLNLDSCNITDAGLRHLAGLKSLKTLRLELTLTGITDAGLEHLKGLTSLRELWIDGTNVTDSGFARLKNKLPGLERGTSTGGF